MTAGKPVTVTDNRGDHVFGRLRDVPVEMLGGREPKESRMAAIDGEIENISSDSAD